MYQREPFKPKSSNVTTDDAPSQALGAICDKQIIARVLSGDIASFELIMRRYNQRLYRIVRGILANDASAEEVVQEAYLRAYKNLNTFESRSSFATWLTRIAVYEAISRSKRDKRMSNYNHHELQDEAMIPKSGSFNPEYNASNRELKQVLVQAVDALPVELRVVFVSRVVEQMDIATTASCLNISESNVNVRLHRARARLRQIIDHQIGVEARQLFQFDGKRCDLIVKCVLNRLT